MVSASIRVRRLMTRFAWLGIVPALAAAAGCGEIGEGSEGTVTTESAVAQRSPVFKDGSGVIQIQIKWCDWAPAAVGNRCAYCVVDSGWVRVGGGAEIEGSPASARLRSSFPFPGPVSPTSFNPPCFGNGSGQDLSAWVARSSGTTSHKLRAYVVQMQIGGMTAADLIGGGYLSINENTSELGQLPLKDTPVFSSSHVLVGGGVELVAPGGSSGGEPNGYLTESAPLEPVDNTMTWRGRAVIQSPDSAGVKVFAIGLDPCLPIPGMQTCLNWKWRQASASAGPGYVTVSAVTPYPWVTMGVGGRGLTSGVSSSRYLADGFPLTGGSQGFTVTTTGGTGPTTGYAFNLMSPGWDGNGTWLHNSIRFNNTWAPAFSRPPGTAPVTLQQSTANPDSTQRRFYLKDTGNGVYQVRFGNPGSGTECAFRQAGNSNVRVGTCGTSLDYLFTQLRFDDVKLVNLGNGLCIDNNNLGNTTGNLVFSTCASGYSARQSVFFDNFSWPP